MLILKSLVGSRGVTSTHPQETLEDYLRDWPVLLTSGQLCEAYFVLQQYKVTRKNAQMILKGF